MFGRKDVTSDHPRPEPDGVKSMDLEELRGRSQLGQESMLSKAPGVGDHLVFWS